MPSTQLSGSGPITFMNTEGQQVFVPLSALKNENGTVTLLSSWATDLSNDQTTIELLANALMLTGELAPVPETLNSPTIFATASFAGRESNNIVVKIDAAIINGQYPTPSTTQVTVTVTETDVYPGLTGAADAVAKIGVDGGAPAGAVVRLSTGLVAIKYVDPMLVSLTMLPKALPATAVPAAGLAIKGTDNSTIFTLVPAQAIPAGATLTAAITLDSPGTFTITIAFTATEPAVTLDALTSQTPTEAAPYRVQFSNPTTTNAIAFVPSITQQLVGGTKDTPATVQFLDA